jgi:calcium/calmodulin-dependent protein kinase I
VILREYAFKSQQHWEFVLGSDVKLSERFQSVKRTIYGLGFTCVVVMGINKNTNEVRFLMNYMNDSLQDVAIKVIMKSKLHTNDDLIRARFELELHSKLSSPHILPFLGGEETGESVIIITPLATADLNSLTSNRVLGEENCKRLCKQLLLGLDYLHSLGLVHGDIKPQNVLAFKKSDKYTIRICDFGFTEKVGSDGLVRYQGMRGSLGYFAPEQLRRRDYGQAVDMFALGIIIYTLLCGYEPFFPSNKAGLLTGDEEVDSELLVFEPSYWAGVSSSGREFVKSLLHGDPSKRLTAHQALTSKWIEENTEKYQVSTEDAHIQFE